jgi:hypothetical protein
MTDEEYEQLEAGRLAGTIAWLETADPDDWHRFALDFQWAESFDTLYWIVRQERCDTATAQMLFWQFQPGCFIDEDDGSGDESDPHTDWNKEIVVHIARRFLSGGYLRSEIAYTSDTSTRTDYVDLLRMEQELKNPNFRTAAGLIENRVGREVCPDREFYARFPEQFWHGSPPSEPEDGVEYVLYEPTGYAETMRAVDLVEQAARRALPPHLKMGPDPEIDLTEVHSEARWLHINMFCLGALCAAIPNFAASRAGPAVGGAMGVLAASYVGYLIFLNFRKMKKYLGYNRVRLRQSQLAVLVTTSFPVGASLAYLFLIKLGMLTTAFGFVPIVIVGVILITPTLWFFAKLITDTLISPRSLSEV